MRLIDANVLMPNAEYKGKYDTVNAYDIVNCPTIEAEPVKHGRWERIDPDDHYDFRCECSNCRSYRIMTIDEKDEYNYCPGCGAKMDL